MREYLHETVPLRDMEVQDRLLDKLSPAMQAEISYLVNAKWVEQVWYLGMTSIVGQHELRIELSASLHPFVFPPGEFCPSGFMYIVQRGNALWAGKMYYPGSSNTEQRSVWGDDVVLDPSLQLTFPALAATYLQVLTVDGTTIVNVISKFPDAEVEFNKIKHRWAVRRSFVQEVRAQRSAPYARTLSSTRRLSAPTLGRVFHLLSLAQAERRSFKRGGTFRGRLRPLYARDLNAAGNDEEGNYRQSSFAPMSEWAQKTRSRNNGALSRTTKALRSSMATRRRSSVRSAEPAPQRSLTGSFSRKPKVGFKDEAESTDLWAANGNSHMVTSGIAAGAASETAIPRKNSKTSTPQKPKPVKKEERELQKKKAAVALAASVYGLDGMKANMQVRLVVPDTSNPEVLISRLCGAPLFAMPHPYARLAMCPCAGRCRILPPCPRVRRASSMTRNTHRPAWTGSRRRSTA